ncbi:hypothetical protein A9G22_04375 [Gilliamella sp. App2-1]|nr:hypothetical protein A9G23_10505 [Gilliamella apicola]OCG24358.1 hypothetical protein A9G22_04375 [Gilliamella apicola]
MLNLLKYHFSRIFSLTSFLLFKSSLALASVLLLSHSSELQALSATTTNIIQGSAPYLTLDGGITKAYDIDGLLSITLSDGITITPKQQSTPFTPVVLPRAGETFADISMFVPSSTNSISLSELIGDPYNYWGDDDGDGQGVNGVTATGSLRVTITDKRGKEVSRNEVVSVCDNKKPYKVELHSSGSSLSTQYGTPNTSTFEDNTATYYISPTPSASICYLKTDNMPIDEMKDFKGPIDIWEPRKGFVPQSTTSASYIRNFPTTGADGLYFYLDIVGSGPLIWPPVTQGGITASMIPNKRGTRVRVTLTGPEARDQWNDDKPHQIPQPTLPLTFELEGKDSNGQTVLKYGFVLQKWFVSRGNKSESVANTAIWCTSLGYRFPQVKDLTNASCSNGNVALCKGSVGATPPSNNNNYQRQIGASLLSEWGRLLSYPDYRFTLYFWTNDAKDSINNFMVSSDDGMISHNSTDWYYNGICVYP